MADEVNENIFLVNAPAGSGKTTWIRQQVESYLLRNPKDNILCITYTNRAAEELGRDSSPQQISNHFLLNISILNISPYLQ